MHAQSLNRVRLFVASWTEALQGSVLEVPAKIPGLESLILKARYRAATRWRQTRACAGRGTQGSLHSVLQHPTTLHFTALDFSWPHGRVLL